jgi:hypothetical protein
MATEPKARRRPMTASRRAGNRIAHPLAKATGSFHEKTYGKVMQVLNKGRIFTEPAVADQHAQKITAKPVEAHALDTFGSVESRSLAESP